MAQIKLITGVPGHGKSLLAITLGLKFKEEGRVVYAAGFKDIDYEATGFKPLPTPFQDFDPKNLDDTKPDPLVKADWMLLEDAVIIYDECYTVMPSRSSGAKVPVHIDCLARHRHYNIDFIFITQKHDQIDNFVRGLVNEHVHVRRKWGFDGAVLKTWDAFQLNVDRKADHAPIWKYPKQNYKLYKSATAHSVKKRIPWFLWAPIPLVALIIGCVIYVTHSFGARPAVTPTAGALATGGGVAAGIGSDRADSEDDALRRKDYAAWLRPRIAGQPWTAPAYDRLPPQGVPQLFCIAAEDGDCKCITEQGTAYQLGDLRLCRKIASEGVYNPFLPVDQDGPRGPDRDRDRGRPNQTAEVAAPPAEHTAAEMGGARSQWPSATIPQSYLPPGRAATRGAL